jgi:putative acetyltransferase
MIRKYQPSDCDALLRVWSEASTVAHPFLDADFLARERHNIPTVYLPAAETWVWVVDEEIAGFMSLLGNEIGALFVDPRRHRSGIGRALVEWAQTLRGELEVEVFAENVLGRAFYAGMGFAFLHERIHDQTGREVMRLRLDARHPATADC